MWLASHALEERNDAMRALTGFTDKRRVGVLVVTILVTVGLTNAGVAWASLTWTTKAPMPTGRQLVSVASNHGIIYALGGNDVESDTATFTDANEAYDPASNTWSTKAQIPQRVASLNSAVSGSDGRIYLLNAENLAGGLASYAYTPATDSWDPVPQMPGAADDGAAVSTGGLIYYIGGFYNGSQSNASNELHVYTIATKTWKTLAPMPTARALLAAAVVGGRIYAIGGCPGSCG